MPLKTNKCCCCDPCNTTRPTSVFGCCQCIPRRLCATFTSYDGCCDAASFLEKDSNDQYTGSIACGSETADVTVSLYKDAYDACFWRVESYFLGVDELFPIGYGGESCEMPTLSITAEFYACSGTIEIARHDHDTLPTREENGRQIPYCGGCKCVCQVLCVTRIVGTGVVTDEFAWSDADIGWVNGYETISLGYDEYGNCTITVPGFDTVTLGTCPDSINISLTSSDSSGSQVATLTCKQCECESSHGCSPCPDGTIYPWTVHLVIPALGVDIVVGNELDEDQDGETDFIYRWESTDQGYVSQSLFGNCEYAVALHTFPGNEEICLGNSATILGTDMIAISCPPDPLIIWYRVRCSNGDILDCYLIE